MRPLDLSDFPVRGALGEAEVRRRIDHAVGRALVDPDFSRILLADPATALGDAGCTPQQRRDLGAIRAPSLRDFAYQAEALFWPSRRPHAVPVDGARLPLAVGL